jgi:hypothetical protein
MTAPDDLDFDFDELEIDETNEEIETSFDQEGSEGSEGGGRESEAGDDGAEANADEGAGAQRQLSRGERRFQSLANKAKDADRRALEAETRNQLLQQQLMQMQQPAQPQYDPRAEQEYIAALDPVERMQYVTGRQMQALQQSQYQQQAMMMDMVDRTMFQSKAASNPVYKKFEAEVEKLRAAEASRGRYFNREDILAFIIGQKLIQGKQSGKSKPKAKPRSSQTVRPGNTSNDVSTGRKQDSERAARAKRVQTYTF